MKMIQKIKDFFSLLEARRKAAKEADREYMAKQYCHMDDTYCAPCIVVGGVPLFTVTDEPTSLTGFKVNIKDAQDVLVSTRIAYSDANKES